MFSRSKNKKSIVNPKASVAPKPVESISSKEKQDQIVQTSASEAYPPNLTATERKYSRPPVAPTSKDVQFSDALPPAAVGSPSYTVRKGVEAQTSVSDLPDQEEEPGVLSSMAGHVVNHIRGRWHGSQSGSQEKAEAVVKLDKATSTHLMVNSSTSTDLVTLNKATSTDLELNKLARSVENLQPLARESSRILPLQAQESQYRSSEVDVPVEKDKEYTTTATSPFERKDYKTSATQTESRVPTPIDQTRSGLKEMSPPSPAPLPTNPLFPLDKPLVICPADKPGILFIPGLLNFPPSMPMMPPFAPTYLPPPPMFPPPPTFPPLPAPPFDQNYFPKAEHQASREYSPEPPPRHHKRRKFDSRSSRKESQNRNSHKYPMKFYSVQRSDSSDTVQYKPAPRKLASSEPTEEWEDSDQPEYLPDSPAIDHLIPAKKDLFNVADNASFIESLKSLDTQSQKPATRHPGPSPRDLSFCNFRTRPARPESQGQTCHCSCTAQSGPFVHVNCKPGKSHYSGKCYPQATRHECLPTYREEAIQRSCCRAPDAPGCTDMENNLTEVNATVIRSVQLSLRSLHTNKSPKVKKYNISSKTLRTMSAALAKSGHFFTGGVYHAASSKTRCCPTEKMYSTPIAKSGRCSTGVVCSSVITNPNALSNEQMCCTNLAPKKCCCTRSVREEITECCPAGKIYDTALVDTGSSALEGNCSIRNTTVSVETARCCNTSEGTFTQAKTCFAAPSRKYCSTIMSPCSYDKDPIRSLIERSSYGRHIKEIMIDFDQALNNLPNRCNSKTDCDTKKEEIPTCGCVATVCTACGILPGKCPEPPASCNNFPVATCEPGLSMMNSYNIEGQCCGFCVNLPYICENDRSCNRDGKRRICCRREDSGRACHRRGQSGRGCHGRSDIGCNYSCESWRRGRHGREESGCGRHGNEESGCGRHDREESACGGCDYEESICGGHDHEERGRGCYGHIDHERDCHDKKAESCPRKNPENPSVNVVCNCSPQMSFCDRQPPDTQNQPCVPSSLSVCPSTVSLGEKDLGPCEDERPTADIQVINDCNRKYENTSPGNENAEFSDESSRCMSLCDKSQNQSLTSHRKRNRGYYPHRTKKVLSISKPGKLSRKTGQNQTKYGHSRSDHVKVNRKLLHRQSQKRKVERETSSEGLAEIIPKSVDLSIVITGDVKVATADVCGSFNDNLPKKDTKDKSTAKVKSEVDGSPEKTKRANSKRKQRGGQSRSVSEELSCFCPSVQKKKVSEVKLSRKGRESDDDSSSYSPSVSRLKRRAGEVTTAKSKKSRTRSKLRTHESSEEEYSEDKSQDSKADISEEILSQGEHPGLNILERTPTISCSVKTAASGHGKVHTTAAIRVEAQPSAESLSDSGSKMYTKANRKTHINRKSMIKTKCKETKTTLPESKIITRENAKNSVKRKPIAKPTSRDTRTHLPCLVCSCSQTSISQGETTFEVSKIECGELEERKKWPSLEISISSPEHPRSHSSLLTSLNSSSQGSVDCCHRMHLPVTSSPLCQCCVKTGQGFVKVHSEFRHSGETVQQSVSVLGGPDANSCLVNQNISVDGGSNGLALKTGNPEIKSSPLEPLRCSDCKVSVIAKEIYNDQEPKQSPNKRTHVQPELKDPSWENQTRKGEVSQCAPPESSNSNKPALNRAREKTTTVKPNPAPQLKPAQCMLPENSNSGVSALIAEKTNLTSKMKSPQCEPSESSNPDVPALNINGDNSTKLKTNLAQKLISPRREPPGSSNADVSALIMEIEKSTKLKTNLNQKSGLNPLSNNQSKKNQIPKLIDQCGFPESPNCEVFVPIGEIENCGESEINPSKMKESNPKTKEQLTKSLPSKLGVPHCDCPESTDYGVSELIDEIDNILEVNRTMNLEKEVYLKSENQQRKKNLNVEYPQCEPSERSDCGVCSITEEFVNSAKVAANANLSYKRINVKGQPKVKQTPKLDYTQGRSPKSSDCGICGLIEEMDKEFNRDTSSSLQDRLRQKGKAQPEEKPKKEGPGSHDNNSQNGYVLSQSRLTDSPRMGSYILDRWKSRAADLHQAAEGFFRKKCKKRAKNSSQSSDRSRSCRSKSRRRKSVTTKSHRLMSDTSKSQARKLDRSKLDTRQSYKIKSGRSKRSKRGANSRSSTNSRNSYSSSMRGKKRKKVHSDLKKAKESRPEGCCKNPDGPCMACCLPRHQQGDPTFLIDSTVNKPGKHCSLDRTEKLGFLDNKSRTDAQQKETRKYTTCKKRTRKWAWQSDEAESLSSSDDSSSPGTKQASRSVRCSPDEDPERVATGGLPSLAGSSNSSVNRSVSCVCRSLSTEDRSRNNSVSLEHQPAVTRLFCQSVSYLFQSYIVNRRGQPARS